MELRLDLLQTELPAVVVARIKTVDKQGLQQLLVEVELVLLAVLVQLETQVVQHPIPSLAMVLLYKAAHHVIKPTQKVVEAVAVVTSAVAEVPIKLQAADQKMVAVAEVRAILI